MALGSRRRLVCVVALCAASLAGECSAAPPCAGTIADLRALLADTAFPLEWHETTMDDGKPLVLSILEKNGTLHLAFVKTGEGLWVEGGGIVCLNGTDLEAHFAADQVRLGPAANWAVRYAFDSGAQFTLRKVGTEELRIATTGWSGTFACRRGK